jgi:hypothetical protein
MKTSAKTFWFAGCWYLVAIVFYFVARSITSAEWERLRESPFYGSTLDIYPTYNWAHYTAAAAFFVGVGITIGGIMLNKNGD